MESARTTRDRIAEETFVEFGVERLRALCEAGFAPGEPGESNRLLAMFQRLLRGWGEHAIGHRPRYPSNVADDEAPYEFSIALANGKPEVQVYVEAQGEPPTLDSNMAAGRRLLQQLADDP